MSQRLRPILYLFITLSLVATMLAVPADSIRVSLSISEGTSMAAALSPDGRTIVIDLLGVLWTLPAGGGAARRIIDDFADARQSAWAPDAKTIAFQSYRDGTWHIWSVRQIAADNSNLAKWSRALRRHATAASF